MKPNKKLVKRLEAHGVSVLVDDEYTRITYYTNHGGEEVEEIPHDSDMAEWLRNAYDEYDASYEAYLWLDNTGHGKRGAPSYMGDVLADKEEWEAKLEELSIAAAGFYMAGSHKKGGRR